MAMTTTELKKLQRDMRQLQKRVAKLEAQKNTGRAALHQRARTAPRRAVPPPTLKTNKEIIAFLKSQGVMRDLTDQEKKLAAEWRALSPHEKEKVNREVRNIRLDQTVAELIAEVRS